MPRPKNSVLKSPSTRSKSCSSKTKLSPSRQTPSSKRTTSNTRQKIKKTSPSTQESKTTTIKKSTTKSSGKTIIPKARKSSNSATKVSRTPTKPNMVSLKKPVKKSQQLKVSLREIKILNSKKKELFPYVNTFPYFLDDQSENKKCWFVCHEHAEKYIQRYRPKYKLYHYNGKTLDKN